MKVERHDGLHPYQQLIVENRKMKNYEFGQTTANLTGK